MQQKRVFRNIEAAIKFCCDFDSDCYEHRKIELTEEEIDSLLQWNVLRYNNGEYCTIIMRKIK